MVLINLSATIDFPLLFFYDHDFIDLLQNLLALSTHILFVLRFDSSKIFWKALVSAKPFLSFKRITHACLP